MPVTTDASAGPDGRKLDSGGPDARSLGRVLYTRDELARRVEELGREISGFYRSKLAGESLLVLGVLKGSFVFLADLVRTLELPVQVEFIGASSYGDSTVSSGVVELLYEPAASLEGRYVLLVEDIVDTGTTLDRLQDRLAESGARSVEVCALLLKEPEEWTDGEGAREGGDGELRRSRWMGFDAPDEFLVGYGLDYSENFRHLPHIATLKEPVSPDVQAPGSDKAPPDGQ